MPNKKSFIRGIFVNSHIAAFRNTKGEDGIKELEKRLGRKLKIGNLEYFPVADESRLLDIAVDILNEGKISQDKIPYEAGRLHFKNWTTTPWAKLIFTVFRRNLKYMFMHASLIAERVFKGSIKFSSVDLGPKKIKLTLENSEYPLEHFRGFLNEWISYFGLKGEVIVKEQSPTQYEYTIKWE